MALFQKIKCKRCGNEYSSIRKKCPKCGTKAGAAKAAPVKGLDGGMIAGIIVLLLIVIATVILLTLGLKNAVPESSAKPAKASSTPKTSSVTAAPSAKPSTAPVESTAPVVTHTPEPTPTPTPTPIITDVSLNRSDFTLSKIGETFQMKATLYPLGSDANIIWISEDENVCTVDDTGLVTAVDHGSTIVSATAAGFTRECIVRVTAHAPAGSRPEKTEVPTGSGSTVVTVSLSHTDVTLRTNDAVNGSFTLKVSCSDNGATVTFASEDEAIAAVTSNGVVTAVGKGTTNVIATIKPAEGDAIQRKCIIRVAG